MDVKIAVYQDGEPKGEIHSNTEETLLQALLSNGYFVNNPCNGQATCGKCKVRILEGQCASVSPEEQQLLAAQELANGVRLSCVARPTTDITLELLQKDQKHKVLTAGVVPSFEKDALQDGYGFAIDIGTTTVVVSLIDLSTGNELATASDVNAQKHFGLDVLTRITYEYEQGTEGIQQLQQVIVASLNKLMTKACTQAGVAQSQVSRIHVAANCTMTHMLLGVDARSLGKAPYTPKFTQAQTCIAGDIGLVPARATLYCLPHVSAYIGADIVAGAYVCDLQHAKQNELFIDIGTNGEIVLSKQGRLFSCSCAAGPALEGMNISSGMRAEQGAIEDLSIASEGIRLVTIDNAPARGLCGSGILAAVRELVKTGIVQSSGVFVKPDALAADDWRRAYLQVDDSGKRALVLAEDPQILVTQSDVRQVQMAKGALLSGFTALLNAAGLSIDDLDKVYIAGQFGAHLPASSLIGSGILPPSVQDKLVYVGNSSKTGAYMTLLSNKAKREMESLAKTITYLELAETENYDRLFSKCMRFPVV